VPQSPRKATGVRDTTSRQFAIAIRPDRTASSAFGLNHVEDVAKRIFSLTNLAKSMNLVPNFISRGFLHPISPITPA
jgi:hypothetical protein